MVRQKLLTILTKNFNDVILRLPSNFADNFSQPHPDPVLDECRLEDIENALIASGKAGVRLVVDVLAPGDGAVAEEVVAASITFFPLDPPAKKLPPPGPSSIIIVGFTFLIHIKQAHRIVRQLA